MLSLRSYEWKFPLKFVIKRKAQSVDGIFYRKILSYSPGVLFLLGSPCFISPQTLSIGIFARYAYI